VHPTVSLPVLDVCLSDISSSYLRLIGEILQFSQLFPCIHEMEDTIIETLMEKTLLRPICSYCAMALITSLK